MHQAGLQPGLTENEDADLVPKHLAHILDGLAQNEDDIELDQVPFQGSWQCHGSPAT